MARRIWIVCLSLACTGIVAPVLAQDGLLEDLYGRGVHAYFEQRYEDAHALLTKAITSGLKDPRAYYFRGLTDLRLGRPEDANAEFTTGAEFEAIAAEPVNVGKALERIQGADRLTIEQHRRAGRLAFYNKAAAAAKARYEERIEAEKRVLLPSRASGGAAAAPATPDETDPFNDGAAKPEPVPAAVEESKPLPAETPAAEPKPAAADPFGDEPKPGTPAPAAAPGAAPPAAEGANTAAEPKRGSLLGSLFRATTAGAAKGIAGEGEDAGAAAAIAVPPVPAPAVKDPFAE